MVYRHYKDPSQIFLSKPVNKYLKEHHSKYYFESENQQQNQVKKSTLKKSTAPETYDFTIGRTKISDSITSVQQTDQGFDDFDQVSQGFI